MSIKISTSPIFPSSIDFFKVKKCGSNLLLNPIIKSVLFFSITVRHLLTFLIFKSIGFSQNIAFLALEKFFIKSMWVLVGEQMTTASIFLSFLIELMSAILQLNLEANLFATELFVS